MNAERKNTIAILLFAIFALLTEFSGRLYAAEAYGLTFASYEVVPEKRTSLDLTGNNPVCFSNGLDFSFDLSFMPDHIVYFGYIFRLINDKDQNIDLIYDQKKKMFRLVVGDMFTGIDFAIDDKTLKNEWSRLRFVIDAGKGNIAFYYKNQVRQSQDLGLKSHCFKVFFGSCSEHNFTTRDLPPMRLKNIGIQADGQMAGFWPLNEVAGVNAEDSIYHKSALITNPDWIRPKHTDWTTIKTLAIPGIPSIAFNPDNETLFIIGEDSLYSIKAGDVSSSSTLAVPHNNMLGGNQSIFDPQTKKLYNFFVDQKTVTTYDSTNHRWNRKFNKGEVTEFWQANKFIANDSCLYIIGGYGQLRYKNTVQKYNFTTNGWSLDTVKGDFLEPRYLAALGATASGDTAYLMGGYGSKEGDQLLSPRYFYDLLLFDVRRNKFTKLYSQPEPEKQFVFANSFVVDEKNKTYYALTFPNDRFNSNLQLIKGSLTHPGYTLVGKSFPYSFNDVKSFADLYYCRKSNFMLAVTLYSNKNNVTEVNVHRINFPVNDLVDDTLNEQRKTPFNDYIFPGMVAALLASGFFYLIVVRKKNPKVKEYQNTGRSFGQEGPKVFLPKDSSPVVNTMSSLSFRSKENEDAQVQVITVEREEAVMHAALHDQPSMINGNHHGSLPEAQLSVPIPGILISQQPSLQASYSPALEQDGVARQVDVISDDNILLEDEMTSGPRLKLPTGKIMLFGNFTVITSEDCNITKQFTPLLKEMFLLILIYSSRYKKGVTAEKLNDLLWNGKDVKDAKNNRSVNLVKLKNILDKVGGCTISRKTGAWKFEYDPALVKIDFLDYLDIYEQRGKASPTITANKLLSIVESGAFLQEIYYEWLDTLKAEISNFVIESLLNYVKLLSVPKDSEKVITISNAIFSFDELNEHALKMHCKSLASLGRHTLAKNTFDKFRQKYKDIYGEEFAENYHAVLNPENRASNSFY